MKVVANFKQRSKFTIVLVLIFAVLSAGLLDRPHLPQGYVYSLFRTVVQKRVDGQTDEYKVWETEHFAIKYLPVDAGVVKMVAQAAEKAYGPVTQMLGYDPGKTTIIIHPDRKSLQESFGWSSGESVLGVYWAGIIRVLSPRDWLSDIPAREWPEVFRQSGPVAHEFTHLVLDYKANGNFPRWFTEGVAQYVEYKLNDYIWLEPESTLDQPLYSLKELTDNFDTLNNEPLAYHESFMLIKFLTDNWGEDSLSKVIASLAQGRTLDQAFRDAIGLRLTDFEQAWLKWIPDNKIF